MLLTGVEPASLCLQLASRYNIEINLSSEQSETTFPSPMIDVDFMITGSITINMENSTGLQLVNESLMEANYQNQIGCKKLYFYFN